MLPFLYPVRKWHFTHKEYNKQYPETYLDEIQEWIEYLSTKYVLCRFGNHSIFIDVFKIWASPGERCSTVAWLDHLLLVRTSVTIRVHFFGKIQNRIIAWDCTDSFLGKKQKIWKGINRGLIPAKETKNPKTDFYICTANCLFFVKTAYHMDFFRILSQRNTKVVNPKNPDSD